MLRMSGLEATKIIRAWEGEQSLSLSERLRIVGLLEKPNDASGRDACLDAGMDEAISKQFDHQLLHATLHRISALPLEFTV
eukprot:6189973-Pleurochrysis_carterae.AAC.3